MKDWISDNYGMETNPTYDQLRFIVTEAWEKAFNEDKI